MTSSRGSRRAASPPAPRGTWVIDGHNVIGRSRDLARLQGGDQGAEARARLEEACSRAALRHGVRVILIFDGLATGVAREGARRPGVDVRFAAGPGRADASIIERANRLADSGAEVTVVSDDRGLLGQLLRGVHRRSVREFWDALAGARSSRKSPPGGSASRAGGEKIDPGPLPDVEQHFLEAEARARAAKARTGAIPARKKGKKA